MNSHSPDSSRSRFEQLRYAREVLRTEGEALIDLSRRLGDDFCDAADLLFQCSGNVIVTGMGKAGLVGQKIAATLASTGTNAHFLHPGEAFHGDLGRIHVRDVVLALSYSGETEEVVRLLPVLQDLKVPIVAVTAKTTSSLARQSKITLALGELQEACSLGLAPSTSTTAMLGIGDAIALVMSRMRQFGSEDFARFHPGGSLGRKLARVEELMRPLSECRIANVAQTVREVLVQAGKPGRRTGAIMLVDQHDLLQGIFTDSDLARLLEQQQADALEIPIESVMTPSPRTVLRGSRIAAALSILAGRKISELPVVDEHAKPIGLIDITDVVGLMPTENEQPSVTSRVA